MTRYRHVMARLTGVLLCAALAGCGVSSQDEPQRIEQPPPPRNTPSVDVDKPTTSPPPSTSPTTTTATSTTAKPAT